MPATLDQVALDLAIYSYAEFIVSGVDPVKDIDMLHEILPAGYPPVDAMERAKEMLKDWAKYETPEVRSEVERRVAQNRAWLKKMEKSNE